MTNNPAAVCAPLTVNLTLAAVTAGSTPGLTFTYYRDAAGTLILSNPTAVSVSGTYYIKGTNGTGCTDIKPVVVTINPLPVASIIYTGSPYCTNGTAIVSLTGIGGGTFVSTPGLSLNAVTGDINLAASAEGTYTVIYSFTNGTCSNSVFTSVTIKNPALVVNNPAATCFPGTIDLTNPAVTAGSQPDSHYNYYLDNSRNNSIGESDSCWYGGNLFYERNGHDYRMFFQYSTRGGYHIAKPTVTASSICNGYL